MQAVLMISASPDSSVTLSDGFLSIFRRDSSFIQA